MIPAFDFATALEIVKYSENQARDARGRFVGGGTASTSTGRSRGATTAPKTKPAPVAPASIHNRIRQSFHQIAGNPPRDSVRLSALRASMPDVSKPDMDKALLDMKRAGSANLMHLDNPPDIAREASSALHEGSRRYHVLWIPK